MCDDVMPSPLPARHAQATPAPARVRPIIAACAFGLALAAGPAGAQSDVAFRPKSTRRGGRSS